MERIGKHFEFGYPSFSRGIDYSYPNRNFGYKRLLEQKKEELVEPLLEKLRTYIPQFRVHTSMPPYPYSQLGMQGLCLHLGDGGRWIEIWDMMGIHFINEHNLDSYVDRAVCFNIGSDVLEFLDPSILAPRILTERDQYTLRYPLPKGLSLIPSNNILHYEAALKNMFKIRGLGDEFKLNLEKSHQQIQTSKGTVHIENGVCEGRGFQSWDVSHASWPIAKLMSLCRDM